MAIHLALMLPSGSSDLPGNSGGPPSGVPLFGLAPGGVYQASIVTDGTGELLPHLFTLTRHQTFGTFFSVLSTSTSCKSNGCKSNVRSESLVPSGVFSVALSSRRRDWVLPSTLSCGARTFLPPAPNFQDVLKLAQCLLHMQENIEEINKHSRVWCRTAAICPALT